MRRAYGALYRGQEFLGAVRARGDHLENIRGCLVLLRAARAEPGRGGRPCRQRFCQGRAAAAADGIRGRGAEADLDQPRRFGRITPPSVLPRTKKTEERNATTRSQKSAGSCR